MRAIAAIAVFLGCFGCGGGALTEVSRTPLPRASTGVTVDESGRRFVWLRQLGLQELTETGLAPTLFASSLQISPAPEVEDVVAISGGRLGLIARNEGYVVNATTGELHSRFCYLPGGQFPQQDQPATQVISQLSRSLGWNEAEGRIYVQPQTFRGAQVIDSQLGQFEPGLEQPLEWQPLPNEMAAGGMAVVSRRLVYLAVGKEIREYDAEARRFGRVWNVGGLVGALTGLAYDAEHHTLLLLDEQQVVEVEAP